MGFMGMKQNQTNNHTKSVDLKYRVILVRALKLIFFYIGMWLLYLFSKTHYSFENVIKLG